MTTIVVLSACLRALCIPHADFPYSNPMDACRATANVLNMAARRAATDSGGTPPLWVCSVKPAGPKKDT